MLIIIKQLEKLGSMISSGLEDWYQLQFELQEMFDASAWSEWLQTFELNFTSLPKKKIPHYSLIFYLVMVAICPEEQWEELIEAVKGKTSYKMMQDGLRIFLESKDPKLRYEVELTSERYDNKYEYVSFFSGSAPELELGMRGIILLFNLLYGENKAVFHSMMERDWQNAIYLCILVNARFEFLTSELGPFLGSDDLLKANGAFFYIMNDFSYLVDRANYEESAENQERITRKIEDIRQALNNLPSERRVHLILNYIFVEQPYPLFFEEELRESPVNIVVDELEKKELNNFYKLIHLQKLFGFYPGEEIEKIFADYFVEWVNNDGNPYIWEDYNQAVKNIISSLSPKIKQEILSRLGAIQCTLRTSSFDQQVRHVLFLVDQSKHNIITTLLEE